MVRVGPGGARTVDRAKVGGQQSESRGRRGCAGGDAFVVLLRVSERRSVAPGHAVSAGGIAPLRSQRGVVLETGSHAYLRIVLPKPAVGAGRSDAHFGAVVAEVSSPAAGPSALEGQRIPVVVVGAVHGKDAKTGLRVAEQRRPQGTVRHAQPLSNSAGRNRLPERSAIAHRQTPESSDVSVGPRAAVIGAEPSRVISVQILAQHSHRTFLLANRPVCCSFDKIIFVVT